VEKLLRQGYIIVLDDYYRSPELFDVLSGFEMDAVCTVISNGKELLRDTMGKKLNKGEVAASLTSKLMVLK
jgi:hypothetical protein